MRITAQDTLLIVAPHPDDDCIGCGGLLALYPSQCDVVLVTDGYDEAINNLAESQLRYGEFERAMQRAGVRNSWGLHIPEHQLRQYASAFKSLELSRYTKVFVPNRYEYHADHVAVYEIIRQLLHKQKSKASLWEYEIWTTLRFPNFYLDISGVVDKKKDLILEYQSQMKSLDFVAMTLGLNAYRGLTKQMRYAEAYYCEQEERDAKRRAFRRSVSRFLKSFFHVKNEG